LGQAQSFIQGIALVAVGAVVPQGIVQVPGLPGRIEKAVKIRRVPNAVWGTDQIFATGFGREGVWLG
jgi:hypothetical protein